MDEYTSLLSSKITAHNEQPPSESKITNPYATIQDNLLTCGAVQNENTPQFDDGEPCAQLNLNSIDWHKHKNGRMRRLMT